MIFHLLEDPIDEADYIATTIKKLKHKGTPCRDMAVLLRTRGQGKVIREAFEKHKLPYEIVKRINSYRPSDAIALLTFHKAKGLEFAVVFMPGMIEGILPHIKSLGHRKWIDDERKLCYVGASRAKSLLYLTAPRYYRRYSTESSRFLRKILTLSICPWRSIDVGTHI